ncbi:MAG: tRNA (adenosine(37)-N6)-dimethylallyltransferase MiaA [Proteobacteria bacterium]|nr:tRNA (adenosine(37)-N6)-dimethylallyltransferase MiaA [Pseudomonadota bacterium]
MTSAAASGRGADPLLVIVGPTAVGKSTLAVALASALDGEVVSADSMQVYRGFDIGTAKPTAAERAGVPHHLIDVVAPDQGFSAADFVAQAEVAVAAIRARGRLPIVVGGSGLYVRALLYGLFAAPAVDPALRAALRRVAQEQGSPALHERLRHVDPAAAAQIHAHDFVRISRALEVFEQTGQRISALRRAHGFATPRHAARLVGLDLEPAQLRERIATRADQMLARGWLEEVRALCAAGYAESHPLGGLGYRRLREHLEGRLDLEEAMRQTRRETWRFARRQRNWFAHESALRWFDAAAPPGAAQVSELLRG